MAVCSRRHAVPLARQHPTRAGRLSTIAARLALPLPETQPQASLLLPADSPLAHPQQLRTRPPPRRHQRATRCVRRFWERDGPVAHRRRQCPLWRPHSEHVPARHASLSLGRGPHRRPNRSGLGGLFLRPRRYVGHVDGTTAAGKRPKPPPSPLQSESEPEPESHPQPQPQ